MLLNIHHQRKCHEINPAVTTREYRKIEGVGINGGGRKILENLINGGLEIFQNLINWELE